MHQPLHLLLLLLQILILFLGFLSFLHFFSTLLKWVYKTFLRTPKNLRSKYGSWALITGATDGIGKAFAKQLAKQGLNLILVSRNLQKLKQVSNEIQKEFEETKIKILDFDFSSEIGSGVEAIEEAIKEIDLGLLVNNVGITYEEAMFFHEIDEKYWVKIVKINVEGTSRVTKVVLKRMVERKKGAIVNIGSGASIVVPSHPLFTIYAATKAYIDQLSRCLYAEYRRYGIDIQCQVPLYVATKMTSRVALIKKTSLFVPSPEDYAKSAIKQIGFEPRCSPYWSHSLQWFFAGLLPENVLDSWRLFIGLRRKQIRKNDYDDDKMFSLN